ncbi:MAG: acyl-CoA/acyl-ACP dehydrogenase [Actinomycetota bacterium]|nr:acyl-CoA/acyl-ACP dehydrogenase [Actinomycetota bacterium]
MSTTTLETYGEALEEVIAEVVAPQAPDIDAEGRFPRESIEALARAGLLGLVSSSEVGGGGQGLRAAAHVVERLAEACGSTAMVMMMHYCALPVIEVYGPKDVREAIARGEHLTTLALSEFGSRSHFWTPMSAASRQNGQVGLEARKSWVTSAGEADSYIWSSRPLEAAGLMTLWLVPADTSGLKVGPPFEGLGLRGNASTSITGEDVTVPESARMGEDGAGLDIALQVVVPWFLILNAAVSIGTMDAVTDEALAHLQRTRLEHLGISLAEQPVTRLEFARMRLITDEAKALLSDTLAALEAGREDAQLRVLEIKAATAEKALAVTDLAMRLCGGAAFRKELGVERRFRDSRAARVMAPTTEHLLDFIGRALTGLPLFDEVEA